MISDSLYLWPWWSEITTTNTHHLILSLLPLSVITFAIFWNQFKKPTPPLPPGPRGLPVVGYLPFLGPNLLLEFSKLAQRYGPIFKLKLGSKTHIVISSSEIAKVVLREQDEVFANRDPPAAAVIVSYGRKNIAWSDNNSHLRDLRKVFVHEILSNKNLEASSSFRRTEVRKTINHLYGEMGSEVDIGGIAFLTSLRVMINILWGKSMVEDEKSRNIGIEFREVVTEAVRLLAAPNVSDFFPVLSRFDLQGVERQMKAAWKQIDGILGKIVQERITNKPEDAVDQQGRKDFLQILLELKEQKEATSLDITKIKALLLDIVVAGTDTTSTTVEWVIAELLQNPQEMKKVQDELTQVIGLNNIVEEFHLPKLEYLDAVIKETLRLHPPLPLLIPRSPNQSCKVGGYTVPKGSNVYINVSAIHMDPQNWDNPSEFNPKRFHGTTKFDNHGYNQIYMPFGSGRRKCPGVPIGERMFVYLLASMLHSFDWTLPSGKEQDLSGKFAFMLKKKEPLIAIPSQRLPYKTLYM